MKSVINGLAVGLGRKIAFEFINDVKKEHNIKLAPKSSPAFKEINSFKLGASFGSTSSKLLQILDSIQTEFKKKPETKDTLLQQLEFVDSKMGLLEMQITNDRQQNQFTNITTFYSELLNTISNG